MQLEWKDLEAAAQAGLISKEQAKNIWKFSQKRHEDTPQFRFSHVLYYFGGMLAISAVTLFVTQAWDSLQGMPLFILLFFLLLFGISFIHYFMKKKLAIPAGIMSVFSLALVPLVVYNLQLYLGYLPTEEFDYADFHSWINWYWVPMELVTLLVGVTLFYIYRFPFLLFPISIVLWYMSMDLWPLVFHLQEYNFQHRAIFSMVYGLIVIAAAIYMDFKYSDRADYAFWLYIFGVIIFWGGLSCQESTNQLSKFFYCLINVFMIIISVFLNRRVFAIFGAIGVLGYLGNLAFTFSDSLSFPIILVFIGIIIILFATTWNRLQQKMLRVMRPYIPKKMMQRIDRR